jgi:hypothetical protein
VAHLNPHACLWVLCPVDAYYIPAVFNAHWVSARREVYQGFVGLGLGCEVEVRFQVRSALLYSHEEFATRAMGRCQKDQARVVDRRGHAGELI